LITQPSIINKLQTELSLQVFCIEEKYLPTVLLYLTS